MGKPNKGHKLYWKHVVTFHSTRSQLHTDRGVWLLRTQNLLGSQPTFSRLGKERKESSTLTQPRMFSMSITTTTTYLRPRSDGRATRRSNYNFNANNSCINIY